MEFELRNVLPEHLSELQDDNEELFLEVTKEKGFIFTKRVYKYSILDNWLIMLNKNDHGHYLKSLGQGTFKAEIDKSRKSAYWTKTTWIGNNLFRKNALEGEFRGYKIAEMPYINIGGHEDKGLWLIGTVKQFSYKIEKAYLPLWCEEQPKTKFFIRSDIFFYLTSSAFCWPWVNFYSPSSGVYFFFQTDNGKIPVAVVQSLPHMERVDF